MTRHEKQDEDYMPNPDTEIASDDQRSVRTESAADSDSSDDGGDDDGDDQDEQESEDSAASEGTGSRRNVNASGIGSGVASTLCRKR